MNTFANNNHVGVKHKQLFGGAGELPRAGGRQRGEEDRRERTPEGRGLRREGPPGKAPVLQLPPPPRASHPAAPDKLKQRPRVSGSEVGIRGWSSCQMLREELNKVGATEGDPQICLNPLQILRLLTCVCSEEAGEIGSTWKS